MDTLMLDAPTRAVGEKAKMIRASGKVPGVVYGAGLTGVSVSVDYQGFRRIYTKAGSNTIVNLNIDGKEHPVLVKDVVYDPVSDQYSHIDFMKIDMSKQVTASIKVEIVGISPAVKNLGGILDIQKHEIKIKCLPKDLVHSVQVDVTPIVDFRTSIHVKDLSLPKSITVLDNLEDTVVTATPIKIEEEKPVPTATESGTPTGEGIAAPGAPTTAPGSAEKSAEKK